MTGIGFQDLAAGALALLALAWLVRRAVRKRARPTPFCGECPGCAAPTPAAAAPVQNGFVPLSEFGGRAFASGGRDPGRAAR